MKIWEAELGNVSAPQGAIKRNQQGRRYFGAECWIINPRGVLAYESGGMLVITLRGDFSFWSHSMCCEQNVIIFSCEGLVEGCT